MHTTYLLGIKFVTEQIGTLTIRHSTPLNPEFALPIVFVRGDADPPASCQSAMAEMSRIGFTCYEVDDLSAFLDAFRHKVIVTSPIEARWPVMKTIRRFKPYVAGYICLVRPKWGQMDIPREVAEKITCDIGRFSPHCPTLVLPGSHVGTQGAIEWLGRKFKGELIGV